VVECFVGKALVVRDSVSLSADLKNEYLDFARQHDWKESNNSI
jgi:hypothetical protein